ncbi:MAG: hypothetical protein E7058_04660 [Lentisphaerae bacterium]|nr:hypothetical protein [Lentisphaerota bacterium]
MGMGDLFKSSRQIEREKERAIKKAMLNANKALATVKNRGEVLRQERDKAWNDAREKLKQGQKAAAQRLLRSVQANDVMLQKLDRKAWVFSEYVTSLEMARTDEAFAKALGKLNVTMKINPDLIANTIEKTDMMLEDQADVEAIWDEKYGDSMNNLALNDTITSEADYMAMLENEAAGSIGTPNVATDSSNSEKINAIREKLSSLNAK